eukprot:scaffold106215_cov70-Phaeocystis_antarctica.AAC.2
MPVATRRSRRQSHVAAPATTASSSAPTDPDEPLRQATAESAALLLEDGGLVVLQRVKAAAVVRQRHSSPHRPLRAVSVGCAWRSTAGGGHTNQTADSQRAMATTPKPGRAKVADSTLPTCR